MSLIHYLNRPEYFLQPIQIYRRLLRPSRQLPDEFATISLPWGLPLKLRPHPAEPIEWSLWVMGIYDLSLSEAIWRLSDRGETALDIGANIGYTASLLAQRVGTQGRVLCFEPNPEVYEELSENVRMWREITAGSPISLSPLALSDRAGEGVLSIPPRNRGEATLLETGDRAENIAKTYPVELTTLDRFLTEKDKIGVLKIDVEGHELAVFQGASQLLGRHQIRDILFENHDYYPSDVSNFLEQQGYTIFRIWKGFWQPKLKPPNYTVIHPWEPPNYLATIDPDRAFLRFKKRGWSLLQGKNKTLQ